MRVAVHSSRLLVGGAIAAMHALAVYGLLTLAPPRPAPAASVRPVAVHFFAQSDVAVRRRLPDALPVAPDVTASEPQMPLIELPAAVSERAISAPSSGFTASLSTDVSIPKQISAVEYVRQPAPRYPPQSRRLREQGVVVLRVVIDESGRACDIAVESSSGYARLDRAAREAVANAAFRPYLEEGAPRRAQVLIPIEFFLRGSA